MLYTQYVWIYLGPEGHNAALWCKAAYYWKPHTYGICSRDVEQGSKEICVKLSIYSDGEVAKVSPVYRKI